MGKMRLSIALLSISLSTQIISGEFPIQGEVFPIQERSFSDFIQERIDRARWDNQISSDLLDRARTPRGLSHLKRAKKYRRFTFDPTYRAEETIKDTEGNVVVLRGTKVNPLSNMNLSGGLLFFDGRDEEEIAWAKEQGDEFKWVLINGSTIELEGKMKRPIYFDQQAFYTKKLMIQAVPAKVYQRKNQLVIEEIPI